MLDVQELESRLTPAATVDFVSGVLSFLGDAGADNVTLAVSGGVYSIKDAGTTITLGSGAVAAGYRGSGTSTISGPESVVDEVDIHVGDGTNVVNVKSVHDPLFIWGDEGDTTITLNSVAPTYIGNLSTITAPVQVNAGDNTTLQVSNYTGHATIDDITIDSTGIYLPDCQPVTYSGTFSTIHVWGPHGTPTTQYIIDSPPTSNLLLN